MHQEDQERQAIVDWPIKYAPYQIDLISRRQAGAGQWVYISKMAMLQRIAPGRVQGVSANDSIVREPSTIYIPCVTVTDNS